MANLDNFRGDGKLSPPKFITTWTVTDTSEADDDDVTCTKAAEAGKTHFITFVSLSSDTTSYTAGGSVKATLSGSSSGTKLHFWNNGTGIFGGNGSPAILQFSAPIQLSENENAVFASTLVDANNDQCTFTMGGFTNETRIE